MPYLKQLLVFIFFSFLFSSCSNKSKKETNVIVENINTDSLNDNRCIDPEAIEFLGIEVDSLCVKEKELGKRENLQKLFRYLKLDKYQYAQFIEDTKEYTDFTNLKPKQKYFTITKETDSSSMLQYLVFKLSDFEMALEYGVLISDANSFEEFTFASTLSFLFSVCSLEVWQALIMIELISTINK